MWVTFIQSVIVGFSDILVAFPTAKDISGRVYFAK